MDIKVKTEKREAIDIEVQINDVDDYKKRSLYYWSKLYGETIGKGQYYCDLKKSIVINILDFNLITESKKYHNVFTIKEREENFEFIDDLEIHYIELGKFDTNNDISNLNDLEEWLVFLKECAPSGDINIIEKLSKKKEEISVAIEIMNKLSADELEYQKYLAREKYLMDEQSKKRYAEYRIEKIKEELKLAEEEKKAIEEERKVIQKEKEETENKRRKFLIDVLLMKFGVLPKGYEEKINSLSESAIDNITINITSIEKLEDIEKYI